MLCERAVCSLAWKALESDVHFQARTSLLPTARPTHRSCPPPWVLPQVVRRVRSSGSQGRGAPPQQLLQQAIADQGPLLAETEVDALLHQLWELKQGLQEKQREASMELLLHFLQNSRWGSGPAWRQVQRGLPEEGRSRRQPCKGVT